MQSPASNRIPSQRRRLVLALLLVLAVALLFRAWQIDRLPPGLFGDEAVNGLDALDVLAGRPQVFFPANFGREGLHMLVLAPFIRLLGPTALALRLPSVLAGVLTVLATYWLGRELLARTPLAGTLTPLMAALFLATSFWHVHFSRFGIRGVFTPLMAALAFAAFWRGANQVAAGHRTWRWFLVSGLFLGLGVHFYTASRLVPIFLALFLGLQWLLAVLVERRRGPAAVDYPALLRRALWPIVAMAGVAAVVFAPLGIYFVRSPGSLTQRADAVSLFNPQVSGGSPLARMAEAAAANLAQFVVPGAGDQATFYNLPGRAVFDPAVAALALAGLVICAVAAARGSSPHLFLLLWFPVMLLPTFLAVDRYPTLPRALGVLPGIVFFPAVALGELARRLNRRWLVAVLITAVVVGHGALTWRDYFTRWGPSEQTFDAFEGDVAAAARWLREHPGQEVYLSADIYRHPSFVFLHQQAPLTEIFTYQSPLVHFFDGRSALPLPPAEHSATYLFTHNAGPDELLAQAPGWRGFASQEAVAGPNRPALVIARLAAESDPTGPVAAAMQPADISFAPGLRLAGYRVVQPAPGEAVVYLLWQMVGPTQDQPLGLQVQAGLAADAAGQQVAQASGELAYRSSEWAPGSSALTWLSLTLPPDVPDAGQLVVRLVQQANGVPLRPIEADDQGWIYLPLSPP